MKDTLTITIPFYDVDPMQVVWHGNYIKYFEQGRCALLAKKQFSYPEMEKMGYVFPIISLKVKYIRPCVFGQVVELITEHIPCDNCLIFKYTLTDKTTGVKLCQGETRQMAVDLKTKESLYELPIACLEKLKDTK